MNTPNIMSGMNSGMLIASTYIWSAAIDIITSGAMRGGNPKSSPRKIPRRYLLIDIGDDMNRSDLVHLIKTNRLSNTIDAYGEHGRHSNSNYVV